MNQKSAILFFTRSVKQEVASKSFVKGQKIKNFKIANRLITSTHKVALDSQLPVFIAEGKYQQGNSFGKRLANEVEKLFHSGFEKVVIIGNDCPELTADHLQQANQACHSDKIVLGPTSDGGAYLLAFHKKQFDKKRFINLDWETANFLESFSVYSETQQAQLELLTELDDINNPGQLKAVLAKLSNLHSLKKLLRQLIQQLHFNGFSYRALTPQVSQQYFFLSRAP